jgi:hypothetical protein
MADLYDRLQEIEGMVSVLTNDVEFLRPRLGVRSIAAETTEEEAGNRRFYVRATFALIEAVVEQHGRLLLDLHKHGAITLSSGVPEALSGRVYSIDNNGVITAREQYAQLRRKLRAVYRAADEAFGQRLNVRYDDQGWQSFKHALDVRNQITHPKSYNDCTVHEGALDFVDRGHTWFRGLNNEFVRVAREHRTKHAW